MEPVGECHLAEYYDRARNDQDKLSLLRCFFGCLANALKYLHSQRIRHRDIKPQNIIVKGDLVFVTDFGVAYNWENLTGGTTTADSSKTQSYAAPEVIRVEPRNEAADIWSLGCVFLEMVTVLKGETVQNMQKLFIDRTDISHFHANGEGIAIWTEKLQAVPQVVDDAAVGWAVKMLQQDKAARPTAAELLGEMTVESARRGILFCGPCCRDGDDSTTEDEEDDGHLWGGYGVDG